MVTTGAQALQRAAGAGLYFAVDLDPDDGTWRPFDDLLTDPAVVAERVGHVVRTLAERTRTAPDELDARACASIHFLGLASRLVAPPLAAVALTGVLPSTTADRLRWRPVDGGPVPMAWTDVAASEAHDPAAAADLMHRHVIAPLVAPLVTAFAHVSPTVLWGNVASALAGASSMLLRADAPLALDPRSIAAHAVTRGPLAGTGSFDVPGQFFRRASCCLFYRIPGGGKCGDCVLLPVLE